MHGDKKIEYRTFNDFWFSRLSKKYEKVIFQLGYHKNAPRMEIPIVAVELGIDPDTNIDCFLIHLDIKNLVEIVPFKH